MPKQGMKRPDRTHVKPKNEMSPVPQIQGKAKSGKVKANALMETSGELTGKVYHKNSHKNIEDVLDTDLARDNIENDLPKADMQDL